MRDLAKTSLLFAVILLFANCRNSSNDSSVQSQKTFENTVYTIDIPEGWRLADRERLEEGVDFISIEKRGFDSSGMLTLLSSDFELDLDYGIGMNIEEIKDQILFQNVRSYGIQNDSFGSYAARSARYTLSVLGLQHAGMVYGIQENGHSVFILKQEATEDFQVNESGFEELIKSFTFKSTGETIE
jgi:hypothetical protein